MEMAAKAQQRAVAVATKEATEAAVKNHYPKVQAALKQEGTGGSHNGDVDSASKKRAALEGAAAPAAKRGGGMMALPFEDEMGEEDDDEDDDV